MQNNIVYTPDDVSHALDVLEQYIQTALSEASNNQVDNTVSVQLREITKAIERLEKIKIPVPDCLLKDKSNLLSQLFHSSVSIELVNEIYNRLNMLLERVATILHISNYGNQVKSRKSKLPITKRQILRESIIIALREYNGSAERNKIIENVGKQLHDKLLPGDIIWRDDWKCYVWQNRVKWELTDMRLTGILKPMIKPGIWELDDIYMGKS